MTTFWSLYITALTVGTLIALLWLVFATRKGEAKGTTEKTMGHSYDGIEEYDNPLPKWWSVPGLARIGLGHEGGVHLVVVGDVLDQALEQHRVVAGLEGVVDVVEVDLELRRCGLGDDGVGRDALGAGAVDDVEGVDLGDVHVQRVDHRGLLLGGGGHRLVHPVDLGDPSGDAAQAFAGTVGDLHAFKAVALTLGHGTDLLHAMQALSQLSYSPEFAIRRAIFRSLRQPSGRRHVHPLLGRMNMKWRPLGDSNPCYRRERAVSRPCQGRGREFESRFPLQILQPGFGGVGESQASKVRFRPNGQQVVTRE